MTWREGVGITMGVTWREGVGVTILREGMGVTWREGVGVTELRLETWRCAVVFSLIAFWRARSSTF